MNQVEAAHLVAILAAAFPSAKVDSRTVEVYVENLIDLDYESGREAVDGLVRCNDWFPTIAQIRREILNVTGGLCPTREQAWYEVEKNMRLRGRNGQIEWSHPAVQDAVKAMGWVNMCLSENIDVIRGQFFKVYDSISQRADREVQIDSSFAITAARRGVELNGIVSEA